jgi:hypothetical protein
MASARQREAAIKGAVFAGTGIRPKQRLAIWRCAMLAATGRKTPEFAAERAAIETGLDISVIMQIIEAILKLLALFK